MSYATPQDMIDSYGSAELVRLTVDAFTEASTPDLAKLQRRLDEATAEIDSYIAKWLPLTQPVPRLALICQEIARYNLYSISAAGTTDDVRQRYEDQIAWLVMVAKGQIELGSAADGNVAVATEEAEITYSQRLFSRSRLRGL